ncbi:MAG: methylmalonyl Co-A mutase-associated GTPase MeaB [Bdellovibrionaceae bacterium]|nr:methylmalonyl Co-A mutase-associated GTPase MeaB [Pseudobdellovibrionaceae bacterium]
MKELLLSGDRRALAKAITLVESQKPEHQKDAQKLLSSIMPYTGKSFRLGVSGPPGVGKSTFIEGFGTYIIEEKNKKVAVLAVDPSSPISGGSLLADKTRMEKLSLSEKAFVRPSPSSGALGGVANKTRECMFLCEAAGFDFIIIETVGVGQSEYEVANMVDFFATLMLPNAGDEIQGIKKGLLELADAILVNKWDGELKQAAEIAAQHYKNALAILHKTTNWITPIHLCSSIEKQGFDAIYNSLTKYQELNKQNANFQKKRLQQNKLWFESLVHKAFLSFVNSKFKESWEKLSKEVEQQKKSPYEAMNELFQLMGLDNT